MMSNDRYLSAGLIAGLGLVIVAALVSMWMSGSVPRPGVEALGASSEPPSGSDSAHEGCWNSAGSSYAGEGTSGAASDDARIEELKAESQALADATSARPGRGDGDVLPPGHHQQVREARARHYADLRRATSTADGSRATWRAIDGRVLVAEVVVARAEDGSWFVASERWRVPDAVCQALVDRSAKP